MKYWLFLLTALTGFAQGFGSFRDMAFLAPIPAAGGFSGCTIVQSSLTGALAGWYKLDSCGSGTTTNYAYSGYYGPAVGDYTTPSYYGTNAAVDGSGIRLWGTSSTNTFPKPNTSPANAQTYPHLKTTGEPYAPVYRATGGPNGYPCIDFAQRANITVLYADNIGPLFTSKFATIWVAKVTNNANAHIIYAGTPNMKPWAFYDDNGVNCCMSACVTAYIPDAFKQQWHVITCWFNGANSFIRTNGTYVASGNVGTGTLDQDTIFGIHANLSSYPFRGKLAELIIVHSPTTNDMKYIEGQLGSKYGITMSIQ